MQIQPTRQIAALATIVSLLSVTAAQAQLADRVATHARAMAANVIVPQSRSYSVNRGQNVEIVGVKAGVVIVEQVASTTLDIELKNRTGSRQEAELLVPVPDSAAIRGFDFRGTGREPSAELLPKEEAVSAYQAIVARIKDPALLEFVGLNVIRSSVFPLNPHGTQQVRVTYEHVLPADGARIDFMLPRTESIDYQVPWEVSIDIRSKQPISTVYSPSHEVSFERVGKQRAIVRVGREAMGEPGPFQLALLQDLGGGVTASILAYPDPRIDGGYFLLLSGLPATASATDDNGVPLVKRELTIVIDRSGSMNGEKLRQAQDAAIQMIDGLAEGEAFNIIDYSDWIASFAPEPIVKNTDNGEAARHYLRRLKAGGGTNIHDSLLEALRPKPIDGMLPIALFLTDGLPTVGVRQEVAIREAAEKGNVYQRRIFTFGVGYDVNAPLLSHLAQSSRAVSTFVLPKESIESKVSQIYRQLSGPLLAEPELHAVDARGAVDTRQILDVVPTRIPDLFEGDKLVLLGKYRGTGPLHLRLQGQFQGQPKTFHFTFQLDGATNRNSFVPRLWASRKIALLIDEIRQAGADTGSTGPVALASATNDPRVKELADEIVRLSVEFGILTEYTAFLAREGTDLNRRHEILEEANRNLVSRAQMTRVGQAAVNQALNDNIQRAQVQLNRRNTFYDEDLTRVQIARVQQINDRAFFQQGSRWVDGQVINDGAGTQPDRVVTVGSSEFIELFERLAAQNRQGAISLSGEILLRVDGQNVLIKGE